MRSIAVAGGTGPVGKTIVDALVTRADFTVTVLSRKVRG
jgi:nucleoside-diphosphate-sugar epimerase